MISPPEPLNADHDLSAFDCDKSALNDWLRTYALANQAKGFTRVMVIPGELAGDRLLRTCTDGGSAIDPVPQGAHGPTA